MDQSGQLSIHSYKNRHSREVRSVALFERHELHAELILVPPGDVIAWQTDAANDTLFDVVEGDGVIEADTQSYPAHPGKCIFIPAGTRYQLVATGSDTWVVRVTRIEKMSPRHFGRLLRRAVWDKLGLYA